MQLGLSDFNGWIGNKMREVVTGEFGIDKENGNG